MSFPANVTLEVTDEDPASGNLSAQFIEDAAKELDGVISIDRKKASHDTMDVGSILEIVLASGSALAFARGLAGWLKARRGAKVIITTNSKDVSIKTIVEGIDPATAERIVERHVG